MNTTPRPNALGESMPPAVFSAAGAEANSTTAVNFAETLWRYRWAVVLPCILGSVIGLLVYLQLPETYRSTTRLMIEADRGVILESPTGDIVGGVPSLDIVQSQLFSDRVLSNAFNAPRLEPFKGRYEDGLLDFTADALEQLELEPEVDDVRTVQSVVTLLHFEDTDEELCQPVVQAFSESLQDYYNENYRSSRTDLMELISRATKQLVPELDKLEEKYREFRTTAPLAWDENGIAINPHREQQLRLVSKRSELIELLRQKRMELNAINAIVDSKAGDPMLGLNIVGELLDKRFTFGNSVGALSDLRSGDIELANTQLQKDLVPLITQREKLAASFGESHPSVKDLDAQLESMQSRLQVLLEKETDRIMELMSSTLSDPQERAKETVEGILLASTAQVNLLTQEIKTVNELIDSERKAAADLAKYEQENNSQLRKIERTQELLGQLQEQMTRVGVVEDDQGIRVIELMKPSLAYRVGPSILKTFGLGGVLGLLLGSGLAFLLEKNANTFRNPDEISDSLGVPVLAHIPFFKPRRKKLAKAQDDPLEKLDPTLALAHMPSSVVSEAIRSCRTAVFFETGGGGGKIIQITSPLPGDGKSVMAGNLAVSIAQSGKRTLVIDCDLRRPQLTDNFAIADEVGLTDVLSGKCEPQDACHVTPIEHLHVMPSGPIPANPAEALTLPEMNELLELLRDHYDYVILDSPPLLVVTDPSILAGMVDGVLLTMRIRRKSRQNSKESLNILRSVGARILGVIINNSDEAGSSDGYRGYGYYRYGRYTNRYRRGQSGGDSQRPAPLVISGGKSQRLSGSYNLTSKPTNGSVGTMSQPTNDR